MTLPTLAIERLAPGFSDPAHDSQRCFRALLDAMAHPGRRLGAGGDLSPEVPLSPAASAAALCLLDFETRTWLDAAALRSGAADFLRFHCGCPLVAEPGAARFALVADSAALPPLSGFDPGSDEYPDRSATLIIEVASLDRGRALRLIGPGIRTEARLVVDGLPDGFWEERAGLRPLFPRGLDLILTCGTELVAVPRTTDVRE